MFDLALTVISRWAYINLSAVIWSSSPSLIVLARNSKTSAACINVLLLDSSPARYFLKCAAENRGRVMMEGEFNAMSELYKTIPGFVPQPVLWGKYQVDNPDIYYFLSHFLNIEDWVAELNQLCSKLA